MLLAFQDRLVNKQGEEYGIERLKEIVAVNADDTLQALAGKIFASTRSYGPQLDDQTILIVRCL